MLRAAQEWNIDLSRSYLIGDSDRDVECGENAGCMKSLKIERNKDYALLEEVKNLLN